MNVQALSPAQLARLRADPAAPADYVDWLATHGWGEIGALGYMLYDNLVPLEENVSRAPPGYLSFGDDFSGMHGCFAADGSTRVLEWDSATGAMADTGQDFAHFMLPWMAE